MRLPCPVPKCSGTMPRHLRICRDCTTRLLRRLVDVPSLDRHLDLAITRQARLTTPGGGHGETPIPWDERARQAATILSGTLTAWAHTLADGATPHHGPACPACDHPTCLRITLTRPPDTTGAVALWLLRHRARLLARHDAPEAADEILAAIRQARSAIDRPPGLWYAGPCGAPTEGGPCDADLYARHGARTVRCPACRTTHDAAQREDWLMGQVADRLGTATEIARALHGFHPGLTPSMIRGYAHRSRITARGTDELDRPLYRIGDVLTLIGETAASA